jgi:peptidoglycan/xylan/chitin deacetylase (PgdA/CDA1 family)
MFSFVQLLVLGQAIALNANDYPAIDIVPEVNQEWAKAFLTGVTIPSLPLNKEKLANPDRTLDRQACSGQNDWALTYDDGSSKFTPEVLSALEAKKIKATFFVVGSRLVTHHKELKQAYDLGHQIAIHSWSHTALTTLTNEQIVAEMAWTSKIIRDIIGVSPKHVRAPFGDIDPRVRAVLKAMKFEIIDWNRDPQDWRISNFDTASNPTVTPQDILKEFTQWATADKTGSISLQHDIYKVPVSIVGTTLDILSAAKFDFKTVSSCLNVVAYEDFVHSKISPKTDSTSSTSAAEVSKTTVLVNTSTTTSPATTSTTASSLTATVSTVATVSTSAASSSVVVQTSVATASPTVVITSTSQKHVSTTSSRPTYSPKPAIDYSPKTPEEAYEGVHLPKEYKEFPPPAYSEEAYKPAATQVLSSAVQPLAALWVLFSLL